jgi:Mycobacterium membrane protein
MKVLKRAWMPLLIVVVVAIAGFTVYRMHGVFGSDNETASAGAGLANDAKPFNPKRVTSEIFGPQGAVAADQLDQAVATEGRPVHGLTVSTEQLW